MSSKIRRVVTGHGPDGRARVASDQDVEATTVALFPGAEFHRLWGADEAPAFPDGGSPGPPLGYLPPVGGFRFCIFSVPPRSTRRVEDLDAAAAFLECESKLPGLAETLERDHPGMHTTDTVDFGFVLSGEVSLELDDGEEVQLCAGDAIVQNGTRHAWRNRTSEPCRIVAFIAGARCRSGD